MSVHITSVTPPIGFLDKTLTSVILAGSEFTAVTSISFGTGITINSFEVDDDSTISASITISAGATPGLRDVTVTDPLNTDTLIDGFEILEDDSTLICPRLYNAHLVAGHCPYGAGPYYDWDAAHDAVASTDYYGGGYPRLSVFVEKCVVSPPDYYSICRAFVDYDTSNLLLTDLILAAQLEGTLLDGTRIYLAVVSMPAGDPVPPDDWPDFYSQFGDIELGRAKMPASVGDPINFWLSSGGLALIVPEGQTRFGFRELIYDLGDDPPPNSDPYFARSTDLVLVIHRRGIPYISSVAPTYGYQGVTIDVVIYGDRFHGTTVVEFPAGVTVNSFTVVDDSTINANITIDPAAPIGSGDVNLTNPQGTGTGVAVFEIRAIPAPPIITSVTPNSGQQGDTLTGVIIHGYNFTGVDLYGYVDFGLGTNVSAFIVDSDTQITADVLITLQAVAGFRNVLVVNSSGVGSLPNGFQVLVASGAIPVITSITPAFGDQAEYLSGVIIAGTNFTDATDLQFSGIDVSGFIISVDSDIQITVDIAIYATAIAGLRDISVTNLVGTGTKANAFEVKAPPGSPTVTSVTPNSGTPGDVITGVIIAGTGFTGAIGVLFGADVSVDSFVVDTDLQITADITIPYYALPVFNDVSVTNAFGTGTLIDGFEVLPVAGVPIVVSATPNSGNQGQNLPAVVIAGYFFTGASVVSFGAGITVNSFGVDSDFQITADITIAGGAALGLRDVEVTNSLGLGTLIGGFTVNPAGAAPTVASVTPGSGHQNQVLTGIVVAGTNFTTATDVDFGADITVDSFSIIDDSTIHADITIDPAATPGARDVTVTNPSGPGVLPGGFTVLVGVPTVASATPNSGHQDEHLASVVIAGTYLTGATVVDFGAGITVNSFLVDTDLQITADITIISTAVPGARDVSVTTPGGTGTLIGGFTVNPAPPTVSNVSPNHGAIGQTINGVIVTGTYFTGATVIDFGADIAAVIASIDSPTQIRANIIISGLAAPGLRDVSVTTPGGTGTETNGFRVTSGGVIVGGFKLGVLRVPMTQVIRCG